MAKLMCAPFLLCPFVDGFQYTPFVGLSNIRISLLIVNTIDNTRFVIVLCHLSSELRYKQGIDDVLNIFQGLLPMELSRVNDHPHRNDTLPHTGDHTD